MARARVEERDGAILDAVVRLLETEGYEAVTTRRVAAEAGVSLSTIYKLYDTLDELIVKAVERWMEENAYATLDDLPPAATAFETLAAILRTVFAPWERQPHMLVAFIRARLSPGGLTLQEQGFAIAGAAGQAALASLDPELLDDLTMIIEHVLLAALERFAAGEIDVHEIVPILERTLARLLARSSRP